MIYADIKRPPSAKKTMTTLSNDSAATRITAAWRGYMIRKIFREACSAKDWPDFDTLYNEARHDRKRFVGLGERAAAWTNGLRVSENRLLNQVEPDYESDDQQMAYAGDDDTTDWWWNDGGGYADY